MHYPDVLMVNRARKEKCSEVFCMRRGQRSNKELNFFKINNQMALYKKANVCTKCYRDYIHFDNFNPLPMRNAVEAFAIYKVLKKPNLNFYSYKAIVIIILCLNFICYLCLPLLMENVCFQILVSFRKKRKTHL